MAHFWTKISSRVRMWRNYRATRNRAQATVTTSAVELRRVLGAIDTLHKSWSAAGTPQKALGYGYRAGLLSFEYLAPVSQELLVLRPVMMDLLSEVHFLIELADAIDNEEQPTAAQCRHLNKLVVKLQGAIEKWNGFDGRARRS